MLARAAAEGHRWAARQPLMPDNEIMTNAPSESQSWMTRLLMGAIMGAFIGALNLWFYEVSFVRLLAAISGGAAFYSLIALGSDYLEHRNLKTVLLGALAGGVAGILWWAVARPGTSVFLAAGVGIVSGVVIVWWEFHPMILSDAVVTPPPNKGMQPTASQHECHRELVAGKVECAAADPRR